VVDVVDEFQETIRIDVVRQHEAAQRRPVLAIKALLNALGFRIVHVEEFAT
jgi:hypothetical protein